MDYSRPSLADRLAADYVLGTLRGPARRRFEALLPAHPALRQQVHAWQDRLNVLAADLTPIEPSPEVWPAIQHRLFPPVTEDAARVRWWQRLGLWQGLAVTATVAALSVGIALQPGPSEPPVVVVLSATDPALTHAAPGLKAQFVASLSADGQSLVLKPLNTAPVSAQQALELWALPTDGSSPRSLGLISAERDTTVLRREMLQGTGAFAVSVEPAGGSPTGTPTGPVISVGKLQT
jgi:anti-sigma-K factor RskA